MLTRQLRFCSCLSALPTRRPRSLNVTLAAGALILLASTAFAAPIQWTQRTGIGSGYRYSAGAIAADQAGDLIVTGRVTHNPQAGNPDYYLYTAKYAGTDGHQLWEYTAPSTGGTSNDQGRIVRVDSANNAIVASLHESRLHLVKFSGSDGHVLWEGPPYDFFNTSDVVAMQLDANNDVVLTGWTRPPPPPNSTVYYYFYTAKYSGANGRVIWQQGSAEPGQPSALAIDPSGHIIVAGATRRPGSQGPSNIYDFYVAEYTAADGHVRWEYRYADPDLGQANLVAVAANGDAIVFGMVGWGADQYATKLAAADGNPIWSRRITGFPRRALLDLAVDKSGDAIVAGHDATGGDPWSFYSAKYSGADGTTLWEHRTSGSSDLVGAEANAVKLGADGTAFVCGSMWFSNSATGFRDQVYTAVYAPGDGALLWEQRYYSPGLLVFAAPHPLALLAQNNPAVLGTEGDGRNLVTIKYSTASQLLNISTRARVQTGDDALIGGFIVTGSSPKKVLLRAIGPSLSIAGALQDPVLELHSSDGTTFTNDNWRDTQEAEITATSIPPPDDKESAIVATVPPGAHTAIVRGKNGSTGLGLVEVYDIDAAAPATPANISTRGRVGTSDDAVIGGFILRGPRPSTVLVRAIGPSLTSAGVPGTLQDPTLELVDPNGNSVTNDDWKRNAAGTPDPAQQSRIESTGAAPKDDRESALLISLVPGPYTAIVRGKNNSTGVALIEAYNLE